MNSPHSVPHGSTRHPAGAPLISIPHSGFRDFWFPGLGAVVLLLSAVPISHAAEPGARETLTLRSEAAEVAFDLNGGSIGDFHLKGSAINPLNWAHPAAGDKANHAFGHFLCLDRWGPPSQAEGKNGMPYHGEASHVRWNITSQTASLNGVQEATLQARLPMAGLSVKRRIRMSSTDAVYSVLEEVTNENALGRMLNMVQHPTVGPPFLDESTRVDCNGRKGFAQGNPLPHPEEPSFHWPAAFNADGARVNLRELSTDPNPNVVSFAIEETHGWVTATSPTHHLLLGYLWKTSDYPWVSLWRDVRNGKPSARGLEFGSTGLHQPFPVLAQVGSIWNRPVYEFLDASESRAKSYTSFQIPIPDGFQGVQSIEVTPSKLVLRERSTTNPRELIVKLSPELLP